MTRIFGIAFVLLLIGVHCADGAGTTLSRPLSMFRDYEPVGVGYALFGLLLAMGLSIIHSACRVQSYGDVFVYVLFVLLLGVVAVTPSLGSWHLLAAVGLMYVLFAYHAVQLHWSEEYQWFWLHLAIPILLVCLTQMASYGIWQKAMITYFVVSLGIHETVLLSRLPRRRQRSGKTVKVYVGRRNTSREDRTRPGSSQRLTEQRIPGPTSVFRRSRIDGVSE